MSGFQQKLQGSTKDKRKTQPEKTKEALQKDADMTQMLKISDRKFKITIINILGILAKKKVDNMQEELGNVQREKF